MTKLIYIASPIDQGQAQQMVLEAKTYLASLGHVTYDPSAAWTVPPDATPDGHLQTANLAVLDSCDGLLAILRPQTLTIGVIIEIVYAHRHAIPTAVLAPGIKPSWALAHLGITPHRHISDAINQLTDKAHNGPAIHR